MTHALLLSSMLLFSPAQDNVVFKDGFDGKLQAGWKWIREDANEWQIRDSTLIVRSQSGGVWGGNNAKNVLIIRPDTTGKVEARVTVAHEPKKQWEQAGLLWYVDDDNFVKLISERVDGKMYAVLASEQGGHGRVFGKVEMPQANVQLRLAVDGKRITGQWRVKRSDTWSECASCDFQAKADASFGLFTQTGPKDEVRWVRFDSFVITKESSPNP